MFLQAKLFLQDVYEKSIPQLNISYVEPTLRKKFSNLYDSLQRKFGQQIAIIRTYL